MLHFNEAQVATYLQPHQNSINLRPCLMPHRLQALSSSTAHVCLLVYSCLGFSVLMETINHLEEYEMSHSNEKGKQNSYPLFAGWAGLHGGKTCCKCVLSWSIHFYGPSVLMDIPVIMYADHPIEALTCQNLVLFQSNIEYHKRVKLITIKACHVFLCYPASLQKVTCI